jgi:hypothetical protein
MGHMNCQLRFSRPILKIKKLDYSIYIKMVLQKNWNIKSTLKCKFQMILSRTALATASFPEFTFNLL